MPALFTRMSIRPSSPLARSTIARRSARLVTSVRTAMARRPRAPTSSAERLAPASSSSATTMAAPGRPSSRAVARPMPRPPPVTIATVPLSSIDVLLSGGGGLYDVRGSAAVVVHGPLHLEDLVDMRVEVARETADGTEPVHVEPPGGGVIDVVAHVEVHDLADHEVMRDVAHRNALHEPALHADGGQRHARGGDLHSRRRLEANEGELVHLRRVLARRHVHLLGEGVVHD